jgi:hypothetical protein
MDDLRELDEWGGLDRVVVLRPPARIWPLRRLLDGYQTWPVESRGVPVDIIEPRAGLVRAGGGTATPRVVGQLGPALSEVVYDVPDRSERSAGSMARPRVRVRTRCEAGFPPPQGPVDAAPRVEVDALLTFCDDDVPGSESRDLGLLIRGATGNAETIRLSVGQLRGRILLFQFTHAGLDIVLAESEGQREVFRYHVYSGGH